MAKEILRKKELKEFSNRTGLEMGLVVLSLAKERNQTFALDEKAYSAKESYMPIFVTTAGMVVI